MLQSDPCLAQSVVKTPPGSDVFLLRFEDHLADLLLELDVSILELARHVVLSRGKRIRPLLCFFCGSDKADITPDLLNASAILELVHVATLVHDDIIDQSDVRRGVTTLHSFAGEHTSILLGDALFSFALDPHWIVLKRKYGVSYYENSSLYKCILFIYSMVDN